MQITLAIDDGLLEAARHLAKARHIELGVVISEWARRGSALENVVATGPNGFPIFPTRGQEITGQQVATLLADEWLSPRR